MSLFFFYVSLASSESVRIRNVVLDTISPLCLSIHMLILDPTFSEGPSYLPSSSSGKGKYVVASRYYTHWYHPNSTSSDISAVFPVTTVLGTWKFRVGILCAVWHLIFLVIQNNNPITSQGKPNSSLHVLQLFYYLGPHLQPCLH